MEDIEKSKAELLAAGMSEQAVDGVAQITIAAHSDAQSIKNTGAGVMAALKLIGDIDKFMKTQSEGDREIYKQILKKQKEKK